MILFRQSESAIRVPLCSSHLSFDSNHSFIVKSVLEENLEINDVDLADTEEKARYN